MEVHEREGQKRTQSISIVTGAAGDIAAAIAARLADDHDVVLLAD
ncbi:short-chain dehydrogenase, partial [Rhizobium leguminosarum]